MNILIGLSYGTQVTIAPEHTAALVALLPHLRKVETTGYGATKTYAMSELPPEFEFVDSAKLAPLSANELALKDALEKKNSEWVNAFTERDKLKSELIALQARMDELA